MFFFDLIKFQKTLGFVVRLGVGRKIRKVQRILVLSPRIKANLDSIYYNLEGVNLINSRKRPVSQNSLLFVTDFRIISYFRLVAFSLLSFYRCVNNFNKVKSIVLYQLRYSLIYTLMNKHKIKTFKCFYNKYSRSIISEFANKQVVFLDTDVVINLKKEFLVNPIISVFRLLKKKKSCNFNKDLR